MRQIDNMSNNEIGILKLKGMLPTDAGNAPRVKWIVCQRHGYLCDWNGTNKGYNWTPYIKVAHVFPSALAATKACEKIGICGASAVAEMHGI